MQTLPASVRKLNMSSRMMRSVWAYWGLAFHFTIITTTCYYCKRPSALLERTYLLIFNRQKIKCLIHCEKEKKSGGGIIFFLYFFPISWKLDNFNKKISTLCANDTQNNADHTCKGADNLEKVCTLIWMSLQYLWTVLISVKSNLYLVNKLI